MEELQYNVCLLTLVDGQSLTGWLGFCLVFFVSAVRMEQFYFPEGTGDTMCNFSDESTAPEEILSANYLDKPTEA